MQAPVLHCRDDKTISVSWSRNPYNFDPPANETLTYILELQKQGDSFWTPVNVVSYFANASVRFIEDIVIVKDCIFNVFYPLLPR